MVSADCILTCLRLFLFREFHNMVHHHLAVHRFAHLYLVFLIVVVITSFDNHYYEEKDIEVGKPLNCQVSVNHHIELTEEEKAQARQEAIRQYQQEQMNKMRNRDTAKRTSQRTETEVHQPSLFDTL